MAFVGYIASVVAKKSNDARKERRKAFFESTTFYGTGIYTAMEDHKKMSPTAFAAFKKELRKTYKINIIKNRVLILLSALVTLVLVYFVLGYLKSL